MLLISEPSRATSATSSLVIITMGSSRNVTVIILSDIIEEVANCMIDISDKAEKILDEHVPASLKGQCGDIAKIHHRLDVAAFLLEELIKENKLIVPNEKTPLCIWGVKA